MSAWSQGTDPVSAAFPAWFTSGPDHTAMVRHGDEDTLMAPGFTWDLNVEGRRYSGWSATVEGAQAAAEACHAEDQTQSILSVLDERPNWR